MLTKEDIFGTLMVLEMPNMPGEMTVKSYVNNIILWNVPAEMILSWQNTSIITQNEQTIVMTTQTREFRALVPVTITNHLVLDDQLLANGRIVSEYNVQTASGTDTFSMEYTVDPATRIARADQASLNQLHASIIECFVKYAIDPYVFGSYLMWINELIPNIFMRAVKLQAEYYSKYMDTKRKYLQIKKTK